MQVIIDVDDHLIESLGYERVKDLLSDSAAHLEMKIAVQEISEADPIQDTAWVIARQQAWEQEKHKYQPDYNG